METIKLFEEDNETADQSLLGAKIILKQDVEDELQGYKTMDEILNTLGYTSFHILEIIGCCLFYFTAGIHLYAFNILIPVLTTLLKLTPTSRLIMNSIIFIGYAFGSFFVGISTKYFNRKVPLITNLIVYSIFSILYCVYENTIWLIICRFIIGTTVGMITSLYLSNMSEFLPVYYREIVIGLVLSSKILGILCYIFCFKLLNTNNQMLDNWRWILFLVAIPCIISCIYTSIILRESPRLLLNKDKFDDAIVEIKRLIIKSEILFTPEKEEQLRKEAIIYKSRKIEFSFTMLFSSKYYYLTTINLLLLLTSSMTYVSNFFSLPLILFKKEKNSSGMLNNLLLAQSVSIPAIILASLIASLPNIGRKYTIIMGFLTCFIVAFYASIFQHGLIISCSAINFFIMVSYFLAKVYLIESFPSKLRDHGMSVIFVVARIGESFSPMLCELFLKLYMFGPLLFIAILSLIGIITAFLMPFETRGEPLDTKI